MSVTMTKRDGVTVLTFTSDPQSPWPPLCQILKILRCNPVCCSVSERLRRVHRTSQSALGALHIMVGLLNFGLGPVLSAHGSNFWLPFHVVTFPYSFGGVFIFWGIMSICSEKFPSPCLVIINIILNVAGVGCAIAGIVLYTMSITDKWSRKMCSDDSYSLRVKDKCLEGLALVQMLLKSINAVLIALAVLEFHVFIISAFYEIKALCDSQKREKRVESAESYVTV